MSKIIKLTPKQLDECQKDFNAAITKMKVTDGKISFIKTLTCPNEKATLYFDPVAWRKMQALIKEFDKEVAWHGVAHRGADNTKNEYYITDILVYPQKVTGATVNTDQEEYEMWLMQHEDEVFNNIRMQGHSHVNMGVTPSGVDETHQAKILEQLEDDMFYIFLIWNKRGDKTVKIYDLRKNILFETADTTVTVIDDGSGIDEFIGNAKKMVKDKPLTTNSWNNTSKKEDNKKENLNSENKTQDKENEKQDLFGKNGRRKGRRSKNNTTVFPQSTQMTMFGDTDDDPFDYYDYRDNYGR